MIRLTDVCILGGGTAGVIAAIQAARTGTSTILVEKTGMLGGTMTHAGICKPGLFFFWNKQVAGGIGWELCQRVQQETGSPMPDFDATGIRHSDLQIGLNAPVYAMLCDEMVLESGAELLFHAMPSQITRAADSWEVCLASKTGPRHIRCTVLIDCTGDANAVALAGFPVVYADENVVQPGSYSCHLSGVDHNRINQEAIKTAFMAALERGEVEKTDGSWNVDCPNPFSFLRGGHNSNHIGFINAAGSEGKTSAEIAGRRAILRMFRFLRKQPGCENLTIDFLYPECGIRETAVIKGKNTITLADYENGRVFDDAIGCMYYPVDEHVMYGSGLNAHPLKPGTFPTIPRGALLPEGSRNLVVAGRTLSSDRMANSGLRVQCSCMVMGQAAGAMAALAANTGIDVGDLPMDTIRTLLKKHGAILPEDLQAKTNEKPQVDPTPPFSG